jgi:hypothetical protein
MKAGSAKAVETTRHGRREKPALVRTTLVLPHTLDLNLEVLCATQGLSKSEAVKMALTQFLEERGLQPDKTPRTVITY